MKLNKLIVRGLRGFNEEQTIDLNGDLVIFSGSNGCGKTSIGEAIEWVLYGRTLKRMKGDEISKREYQGSYQNAHFGGADCRSWSCTSQIRLGRCTLLGGS